jgi:hypothetical protein
MTHTHTKTMPDGSKVDILFLMELVLCARLIVVPRNPDDIEYSRSSRTGFSKERYDNADTAWPILLRESEVYR